MFPCCSLGTAAPLCGLIAHPNTPQLCLDKRSERPPPLGNLCIVGPRIGFANTFRPPHPRTVWPTKDGTMWRWNRSWPSTEFRECWCCPTNRSRRHASERWSLVLVCVVLRHRHHRWGWRFCCCLVRLACLVSPGQQQKRLVRGRERLLQDPEIGCGWCWRWWGHLYNRNCHRVGRVRFRFRFRFRLCRAEPWWHYCRLGRGTTIHSTTFFQTRNCAL
mmetsp:Transcript_26948/g.62003  ORF Transcript_26948/g.62003 Transcript_26948/m.62003 type:complete len:218 (+) Transcript_26948:60-713(+)